MKNQYFLLLITMLLISCEKEIFLNYHSVEKKYVVEGILTNETSEIKITTTRDMEDSTKGKNVENAVVVISSNDGIREVFEYQENGYYRSATNITGYPGKTYTLSVTVDGQEYTSYSTMQHQAEIISAFFQWAKIMNNKILIFEIEIKDIAGEDNYYCYHMYRNGGNYRWDVFNDRGYADDVIPINIFCMSDNTMGGNDSGNRDVDEDEILSEGDIVTIEIRTIDRRVYDYLYSLGLSERTSANPIDNFTGGCLGYFSAYSVIRHETVYNGIE